jgi:glycerol-3-phosphate dehydrogenase
MVLLGGEAYDAAGDQVLVEKYGLTREIARHLNRAYGDQAETVCKIGVADNCLTPLAEGFPFLEAEVVYAARHELAARAADVLVRRLSLGLLDSQATLATVPRVLELMAGELQWDHPTLSKEQADIEQRLSGAV